MSDLDFGPKPGIVGRDRIQNSAADADNIELPGRGIAAPTTTHVEDEFDRSLRPKTLADFVGQDRIREQLNVFIDAAKQRDEALDHALFAGPPGLGKCVTADTILFTPYGMVPIGSFGDLAGDSWQPITRPVAGLYGVRTADYFYNNGDGATLRVTTDAGYRVEGTPNHPLLIRTRDGRMEFRRLNELRIGDQVAVRVGAQVFGESTKLHIEHIPPQSLADTALTPDVLTPEFARLLGLLLNYGRISPGGDGFVFTCTDARRIEEISHLVSDLFCLEVEEFGGGPFGRRFGQRSPRVATLLVGLGMTRKGFEKCPSAIYRAPKIHVAEFLRGVFWGTEHSPACNTRDRTIAAHLQLMLANFGIESRIGPAEEGYRLTTIANPVHYDSIDANELAAFANDGIQEQFDIESRTPTDSHDSDEAQVGFGVTPAGVLVALHNSADPNDGYRRGSAISHDIRPARVAAGSSVSVAEVEPSERGRAITRDRLVGNSDARALAVRSVASKLRPDDAVELIWEPIVSLEPGQAHTCDVSVPDGHTFIGNGIVCHNTTLASVVANELGSTMHQTSGPALDKKADVAAILTSLQAHDVLFIDEIHRLNSSVEEVLYSAMEDFQIDIVLGQGPAARTLRLEVEPFTLIGATTRTGLLTTPLRDRFGLIHRLEYYETEHLQDIVVRSAQLLGIEINPSAAAEIASRSRGTPRIANRILKRVRDVAQVRHAGNITLDIAQEALDLVDIDAVGLDRLDRAILETILVKFDGGPVGLNTLSVAIGEESNTIEDVYEPFLLQRGFIQRTPRGRIITERGRAHLGEFGNVKIKPTNSALF